MAGSQLPPLPLLLLVLLLPLIPSDTMASDAANSSSSLSYPAEEGPETSVIMHPSTSSSEADSTTSHPASDSWATTTLQPTSLQPELSSHTSSGSPSTKLPLTSHSSPPSSISLTTPHWSSTHSNPSTVPSSMFPASTDGTTLASGLGACESKVILCPSPDGVILKSLGEREAWMGLGVSGEGQG
ncbi:mucin-5AC-like isoform X2 [Sus scrofa]|uniref:mucin-5AC-like isoform X2 n=1 Tax=Sus scrofa TaxID=9823 RepID=UPI0003AEA6C8|nr:mucin-5AC-like isoform X2 [Sus scrofa]